jgi:galactokinase
MSMPDQAAAEAPGRVNLIGEHTDYHEGLVLPAVIDRWTRIRLVKRADTRVRASSNAHGASPAEYQLGGEAAGRGWVDYIQGVTVALMRQGVVLTGFDLDVDSDIPLGAGVSSSAALTVAVLRGLRVLFGLPLDDRAVATVARAAETDFVGAPVGIMDQMACSLGRMGEALFIDTRTLGVERVRMPDSLEFAVIDSGVTHQHAGGGYAERRRESFEAASLLGVSHLRNLDLQDVPRLSTLPTRLARRARHVITENARVLAAMDALRSDDPLRLGELFTASHASLRDDYEVSTPEVDTLAEIAQESRSVYGARMTGGGFGGAVVIAADRGSRAVMEEIIAAYTATTGRRGALLAIVSA